MDVIGIWGKREREGEEVECASSQASLLSNGPRSQARSIVPSSVNLETPSQYAIYAE
jgi:hypothetical protein